MIQRRRDLQKVKKLGQFTYLLIQKIQKAERIQTAILAFVAYIQHKWGG